GPAKLAAVPAADGVHAIDYLRDGWPDEVRRVLGEREATVVLDGVGGAAGRAALELLAPGGRYVLHGYASGAPTEVTTRDLYSLGITAMAAIGPRILRRPGGLRPLEATALAEAAAGRLVPTMGNRFPLAEAAAAHTALESRSTVGKVVLVP
ncbi:MAG TPA: zinc-binding dehydrogenase, partial [Pseudonocardiaceae bacterium]